MAYGICHCGWRPRWLVETAFASCDASCVLEAVPNGGLRPIKLTWLVLGGDPAVRSRRVEQFTAL